MYSFVRPIRKPALRLLFRRIVLALLLASPGAAFAVQDFWKADASAGRVISGSVTAGYFDGDEQALGEFLAIAPTEASGDESHVIYLPLPDGSLSAYSIVESPMIESGLAITYPEIRTFKVYGIDDPGASGRVDITQKGFRAMLSTSQGRVLIDPDSQNPVSGRYMSRSPGPEAGDHSFQCSAGQLVENQTMLPVSGFRIASRVPGSLIEYRLAVSATQQYVTAVGGTKAAAVAEIVTAINRVNQIYERDHGIRLRLVANNDSLVDDTGSNSGFYQANGSEKDGFSLLAENQLWIDTVLGSANYDIGHIFSTGGGGVAFLQAVCDNASKAKGVTGLPNPTGEVFYIDFVAHEIGHQFGAEHTFNGTTSSCGGGNRSTSPTTFEPGSGSTIMAYAGICGAENIQFNSDATFHAGSIDQIGGFVSIGGGNACISATVSAGNPNEPTASAGVDRVIPLHTSFLLEGTGSDADLGDTLSYQWDQMDAGTATTAATIGDDLVDNALFRSYAPQSSGTRNFPALGTQVRDGPYDQSEALPCTARNVNFRLTVRDNKSGQATDDIQITIDNSSGPFRVTSFDSLQTIYANSGAFNLSWNVANTHTGAVNCPNVDIDLLTFGSNHSEYSVTSLATSVPNTGGALVKFLDNTKSSPRARFRVKCSNNIFYDISDSDTVITGTGNPLTDQYPTSGNQTFFNQNGQLFATSSNCAVASLPNPVSLDVGAIDSRWLVFLLGLLLVSRHRIGRRADIRAGNGS